MSLAEISKINFLINTGDVKIISNKIRIMKSIKIILICILAGASTGIIQAQYQDLKGWYNLELGFDIGKRFDVGLIQEFRFKSDLKKHDSHFTQLDLSFKHNNWIEYKIGARYIFDKKSYDLVVNDYDYYKNETRIHAAIILKQKYNNFTFALRTQAQLYTDNISNRSKVNDALIRERLTIEYKIPKYKLTPYFSAELFLEDYKDVTKKKKFGIESNNYRLITGVLWKYAKKQSIKLFYGYEKQLNQVINRKDYILGVGFKFKI